MNEFRSLFRKVKQGGQRIGFINLVDSEFPEGKKPRKQDIVESWPRFQETLQFLRPTIIIALGATVTGALTGKDKFKMWVGRSLPVGEYKVIPMYHPDYARKHKQNQREYETQVKNLVNLLEGRKQRLKTNYTLVTNESEIIKILEKCAGLVDRVQAYDWETTDLDPHKGEPICLNLSIDDRQAYVLYWYKRFGGPGLTEGVKRAVRDWLQSDVQKVAHNAKFEIKWGIVHFGTEPRNLVGDTQQMFHLLDETAKAGLKDLAYQYTDMGGYDLPMQEFLDKGNKHHDAPPEFMLPYAGGDSDVTRQIYFKLREEIDADPGLSWMERNIITPTIFTLARIEVRGLHIDFDCVGQVEQELKQDIEAQYKKISKFPEVRKTLEKFREKTPKLEQINLNSPTQVRYLLFDACKLPVLKETDAGNSSADKKTLEQLEDKHPVVKSIVEVRSMEHDLSEIEVMHSKRRKDDTIYSDLIQDYVVTGRLASRGPNLQNLSNGGRVKQCFDSRWGFLGRLLQADYEQLELRLIGGESEDDMFMEVFLVTGEDLHTRTAADLNKVPISVMLAKIKEGDKKYVAMRTAAKRINFGVVYGITKYGLAIQLNISEEECEDTLSDYWALHPKIRKWMKSNEKEAFDNLCVRNRLGRVRHIPDIHSSKWWIADSAKRTASNSKIQSLGADITMWALTNVDNTLIRKGFESFVDIQVHDSIRADTRLIETPKVAQIIQSTMVDRANQTFKFLKIPLAAKIEIGQRWSDMEKYQGSDLPF
jgi:DNA polymerase-1